MKSLNPPNLMKDIMESIRMFLRIRKNSELVLNKLKIDSWVLKIVKN